MFRSSAVPSAASRSILTVVYVLPSKRFSVSVLSMVHSPTEVPADTSSKSAAGRTSQETSSKKAKPSTYSIRWSEEP